MAIEIDLGCQVIINNGGESTYLGLTDTPSTYSGQAGKVATVNSGETALEFIAASGTGDMTKVVYDPANISEQLAGLAATQSLTNKTVNGVVLDSTGSQTQSLRKDGTYVAEVLQGDSGEIGIGGTAGIALVPKGDFFSFVTEGGLSNTMFYTMGAYTTESEIGVKTGIGHKGLNLTIVVVVKVPGITKPFKIVTRDENNPIVLIKADEIKPKKVALYKF